MKDLGSMLVGKAAFSELVIGNTALVRGMVRRGPRGHLIPRLAHP